MAAFELRTFADIVSAVQEELKVQSSDTVSIDRIKRDINIAYIEEIIPYHRWKWLRAEVDVAIDPVFFVGRAVVTPNSEVVLLTEAPATSKKGYNFAVDTDSGVYRILEHEPGSKTLILDNAYMGVWSDDKTYQIWNNRLVLPTDCKETIDVWGDWSNEPLLGVGLQDYRRAVALQPNSSDLPKVYSTSDFVDPDPYSAISGLPAPVSRKADGLIKRLVFAADISSVVSIYDTVYIKDAGDRSYNGTATIARLETTTVSNDTIVYTTSTPRVEALQDETAAVMQSVNNEEASERYRELMVHPSIVPNKSRLHVDYIRMPRPLEADADEPLMDISDRILIVYGALMRAWSRVRNPEEAARNGGLYQRKLDIMLNRREDSFDAPTLVVSRDYLALKRRRRRGYGTY